MPRRRSPPSSSAPLELNPSDLEAPTGSYATKLLWKMRRGTPGPGGVAGMRNSSFETWPGFKKHSRMIAAREERREKLCQEMKRSQQAEQETQVDSWLYLRVYPRSRCIRE